VRGDINIGSAGTELVGDTTNVVDVVSEEVHAEEIREISQEPHSDIPD
jgi:hypothetical protein